MVLTDLRSSDLLPILEAASRRKLNVDVEKRVKPFERKLERAIRSSYMQAGSAYVRRIKFRDADVLVEAVAITNITGSINAALSGIRSDVMSALKRAFTDIFRLGWKSAPKEISAEIGNAPDRKLRASSTAFATSMYDSIAERFTDSVRGISEDLSAKGLTRQEITEKLTAEFKTRSQSAAKIVASDTAMIAFNNGYSDVAHATGAKRKTWITAGDSRVDEQCIANASVGEIPLDKDFPSGVAYAPAHSSCRCVVDYSWS